MSLTQFPTDEQGNIPHNPEAGAPDHAGDHEPVPHEPGARDFLDDAAVPEPSGEDLLRYQVHAVLDRMVLISDHMAAIRDGLSEIRHHQAIITAHFSALKGHIEEELP
jgi:hypothetical protein